VTDQKKNKNLGFRVTEARQEELKIASARRRQSIQEMIERALDNLLSTGHEVARPQERDTNKNREWHEKLEVVLSRGMQKDKIGIQQNLDWAVADILRRPSAVEAKAADDSGPPDRKSAARRKSG